MVEVDSIKTIEYKIEDLPQVARELLTAGKERNVWLFYGDLGAGKTTLIKEICRQLGVDGSPMSSPTFSIINEYKTKSGVVFHFDFYRMKNEIEILDLGIEEYFDSDNFCFIEWPERLGSLLPSPYLKIMIQENGIHSRTLAYENHG